MLQNAAKETGMLIIDGLALWIIRKAVLTAALV